MCLDFPELKDDPQFKSQLGLRYESDDLFGESKEIEHLITQVDFINAMAEIKEMKGDEETQYLEQDFLIDQYLDVPEVDKRLNRIYKEKKEEEEPKEKEE
jgi:hypothetical protein